MHLLRAVYDARVVSQYMTVEKSHGVQWYIRDTKLYRELVVVMKCGFIFPCLRHLECDG